MRVVIITQREGNHCNALIERLDVVEWKVFLRSAAAAGAQLLLPGTAELWAHPLRVSRQQSLRGLRFGAGGVDSLLVLYWHSRHSTAFSQTLPKHDSPSEGN